MSEGLIAAAAASPLRAEAASRPALAVAPWLAAAAILAIAPQVLTSGTALTMMSLMGIMIVFALSYNMLLGQAGMLSFGHAVYYGMGAFFAVHAMNAAIRGHWPVPLVVVPLVGGGAGLVFGAIFGRVSTRRGGTAFAMISLGLAELVASSANILRSFFGGEEGITTNRTKLFRVLDLGFGPQIQVYYLIAAWCLLCMLAMYRISRTPLGRMCNAVRENPERVQFVGYDPATVRFLAFCLSAFFAGIAGGLAAINFEIVNSAYLGLAQSGIVLLAAFIGGIGYFVGPVLGAIVVTYLQTMLSDVTEIWQLYFGLLFIGVVMFAPGGLAGLLMMHGPLLRGGTLSRLLPVYLAAALPALAMLTGFVGLIEMTFHALVKSGDGPVVTFFRVPADIATAPPWIAASALAGVGTWVLIRMSGRVRAVWSDAMAAAQARGRPA